MTDQTTTATNGSKSPTHIAYAVREGKDQGKGFWTRIGAAWQHKDGKGFSVQFDCVPLDGAIQLRVASDSK